MFKLTSLLCLLISLRFVLGGGTVQSRANDDKGFITVQNTKFFLDGRSFYFYGTVVYWLNMLDDAELDTTFSRIRDLGITVVRTWAFNDVCQKPAAGNWFQILKDGEATINEDPDGLQRLDKIIASAEKFGLKLILTLTNNWNPERPQPAAAIARRADDGLPRGFLSNDYGGMDMYVRAFHPGGTHDLFYTDPTIINAFKAYVSTVVSRYTNRSTILSWELANDPRCASTLPASPRCNPQTITKWVADLSSFVKKLDSRHLVNAGDGGFYCLGCPKLFAPHPKWKRDNPPDFTPRGQAFDGSFGVDTEDITSVPHIDFGSFQLFPDQIEYFPDHPADPSISKIGTGDAWILLHEDTSALVHKPEVLTAFDLATTGETGFAFFNSTTTIPSGPPGGGVTVPEREFTIASYTTSVYNGLLAGLIQVQTIPESIRIIRRFNGYPDSSSIGGRLMSSKNGR